MSEFEGMQAPPNPFDEKDLSWLIPYLPLSAEDRERAVLTFKNWDDSGGLSGAAMRKAVLSWKDDEASVPQSQFVLKRISPAGRDQSQRLGLAREGYFYKLLGEVLINELDITLPFPYYSYGDMTTGEKVLLLEDLSDRGVLSSFYFGKASPVNWGKDLDALIAKFPGQKPTLLQVIGDVFQQVARMHRKFWKDASILSYSWLRSYDWIHGEGRDSWQEAQKRATDSWVSVKAKIEAKTTAFQWDEEIVAVVDASLSKIDWENYQHIIHHQRSWTFVHGDFHPGNIFWIAADAPHSNQLDNSEKVKSGKSVLLDWEMVGLGNGPQELSQYMISHVTPDVRREIEDEVIGLYYRTLTSNEDVGGVGKYVSAEEYSFEQCKEEYIYGGFERWVWFLAALPAFCPEPMIEYWHNQMVAFMRDHHITPQKVGMPRV
eukprot:gene16339-18523_t